MSLILEIDEQNNERLHSVRILRVIEIVSEADDGERRHRFFDADSGEFITYSNDPPTFKGA